MNFSENREYWTNRRKKLGDGAVGRKGEDHVKQGLRIANHIVPCLEQRSSANFPEHGLDFGCGYGRLTPYIAANCGHLWAADIFDDWAMRAASGHITVTPLVLKDFKLPFEDGAIDLIVDAMSTQGLDESAKKAVFKEFRRVARGGALVLSLSNEEPDWTRAMVWEGEPSTWRVRDIDQAGDLYCLTAGCLL